MSQHITNKRSGNDGKTKKGRSIQKPERGVGFSDPGERKAIHENDGNEELVGGVC